MTALHRFILRYRAAILGMVCFLSGALFAIGSLARSEVGLTGKVALVMGISTVVFTYALLALSARDYDRRDIA